MLRKVMFLFISLLMVGLIVVPHLQAQDAEAILKLTEDFVAGRITEAEFERRTQELLSGMSFMQEQKQEQQKRNNWPSNAILNKYGLGSITQPSGTVASFKENQPGHYRSPLLEIEIDEARGHYDTVLAQIRRIPGIQSSQNGVKLNEANSFHLNNWFIDVGGHNSNNFVHIFVENRTLPYAPWAQ